jgi:OOP family OmpA-OmpF porin
MLRYALISALAAAAAPAMAQYMAPPPAPWYLGVGVGQGNLDRSGTEITGLNNAQLDTSETTYTVRMGYRFSRYWALEAAYYDLGKYAFHGRTVGGLDVDGEAKAKGAGVNLVGILPIDRFDLYGRLGWIRTELKVNASATLAPTPVNQKDKENGALYGVGGRWNFMPNMGLFVEWDKADKIRVDSYLVGIDFRF